MQQKNSHIESLIVTIFFCVKKTFKINPDFKAMVGCIHPDRSVAYRVKQALVHISNALEFSNVFSLINQSVILVSFDCGRKGGMLWESRRHIYSGWIIWCHWVLNDKKLEQKCWSPSKDWEMSKIPWTCILKSTMLVGVWGFRQWNTESTQQIFKLYFVSPNCHFGPMSRWMFHFWFYFCNTQTPTGDVKENLDSALMHFVHLWVYPSAIQK